MSRRIKVLIAGTTALFVIGFGVALAAWLVSGSGNGAAKAGSLTTLTVNSATAATADLYPGGTGALYLSVTNPNNLALNIVSVSPNGAITSDKPGCGAADVTFTAKTGLSVALLANESNHTFNLPAAVTMVAAAADECQGATFTIPVTVQASTP